MSAVKKISIIAAMILTVIALSFSASALHTIDGGVYTVEVQTGADGEAEAPEEIIMGKTENLSVVKSSRGAVTLSWDKTRDAYAYQVFIKYATDKKFRYACTTKSNEVTIDEIEDEGGLRFKVRAFRYHKGKAVFGEYSDTVNGVTKPADVENIYTRDITDDSVTLYWDKAKGATNYRVYIYDTKKQEFKIYRRTSRTTATVKGLKKDTRYIFKIMSYKKIDNSVAFGDFSREYKEYTYNSGSAPHTAAQTARYYNDMIANLKAQQNMTVKYQKTVDTEFISCSKKNLAMSVKNTLNLFEGTLKKNYEYVNGVNEVKSANKLIEPYSKKPSLEKNDIKEYSVKEKDGEYIISITLKEESKLYNKGDSKQKSYFDGAIALPEFKKLKTAPLVIESADSYYDGGTLKLTVSDNRVSKLSIRAAMLTDIDFSVADVKASTVVGYELTEKYSIVYNDEAQ